MGTEQVRKDQGSSPEPGSGARYWRSLEELAGTPEFRAWWHREFPAGAGELRDGVTRRHFMRIMSASFLLAGVGLTGCRRPVETIHPFSKLPEGYVHGRARYYATAMPVRGSAIPLLVKSHDGRPVKVEGNPEHPIHRIEGAGRAHGGTHVHAQASILDLYDPDRARRYTFRGETSTREKALDALADLAGQMTLRGGKGLAILLGRSSSPTRERLLRILSSRLPEARVYLDEPVDDDLSGVAAAMAFGLPVRPVYRLERAKRIVALDCDLLGGEGESWHWIRGFSRGRTLRQPTDQMNRLYVAESLLSVTGANADHRLRLPASSVFPLACWMFAEFIELSQAAQSQPEAGPLGGALRGLAAGLGADAREWASVCVKDLLACRGSVAVLAGYRQPVEVHLLALAFNYYCGRESGAFTCHAVERRSEDSMVGLARALGGGEVEAMVVLGGNPVYTAPADLEWEKTQRRARTVFRLGASEDESFPVCDWHLPMAHYLESWGDARTPDGSWVPVQPLIEPLFGGLTEIEVLARLAGSSTVKPYELVRETLRERSSGAGEEAWARFLHDGYLAGSAGVPVVLEGIDWGKVGGVILAATEAASPSTSKLELVFTRDSRVDDGRYANNGWLQELPDPLTKIVWDNVLMFSPKTAAALGVAVTGEDRMDRRVPVVRVTVGDRFLEGPAWIQPGQADDVVGVVLGYGRMRAGRVGKGIGYNGYLLRTSEALHFVSGARVALTGKRHPLSCTQDHGFMQGRPVIREANLEEYRSNPRFARDMDRPEVPATQPLYPNPLDAKKATSLHQWGMVVDLGACVGCAACVIACQSENNIPIVGKDQVRRNREMHWMRIDRYYAGPIEDPEVVSQPVMCQHCEAAPCESVCPVNATVHDHEGLNVMAYNRCVGTRYCSNNCPYKVRRFNFFDYNRRPIDRLYESPVVSATDGEWELKRWFQDPDRGSRPQDEWDLLGLARNPEVTVRMRGVMEKCTFCGQRIEQAKIAQKAGAGASDDVVVRDGAIRTACEQACPAHAIVFGNLGDPQSAVSQARDNDRGYQLLEFLAVRPRVTYLARVRNPNPEMPGSRGQPRSTEEHQRADAGVRPAAGRGQAVPEPAAGGAQKGGR